MMMTLTRALCGATLMLSASLHAADTANTGYDSAAQAATSTEAHLMPPQFGPVVGDSSKELLTRDKLDVTIQLEVDSDAAQTLLPTWKGSDGKIYGYRPLPMGPTGKPILFVNYTQERDVDYMAGGGYNEIEFYMSAEFVGENSWQFEGKTYNAAQGMFAVLLMPSDLIPLLIGRELLGTPKHLADVGNLVLTKLFPTDESQSGWFEAHDVHGAAFIAGTLRNVVPAPYDVLKQGLPTPKALSAEPGWGRVKSLEPLMQVMLWKYVPAANWVHDRPDVNVNIAAPGGHPYEELSQPMVGDGFIVFPNALSAVEHPNLVPALLAVKELIEKHASPFPGNTLVRHYSNSYRAQDFHAMDSGPDTVR